MSIKDLTDQLRRFTKQKNVTVVMVPALVGACALGAYMISRQFHRQPSGSPLPDIYYYDLDSGKLFNARAVEAPPILVPGATTPRGVVAYVFSCGQCADEKERFIGYLESYQPDQKKWIMEEAAKNRAQGVEESTALVYAADSGENDPTVQPGHMIAQPVAGKPGTEVFYPWTSDEGVEIREVLDTVCPGKKKATSCLPLPSATSPAK